MTINTNVIVSMTDANHNFSKVAKLAEKNGEAIIFKNNRPKFVVIDMEANQYLEFSDDERIDIVAARIAKKIQPALEQLAK